MMSDKKFYIWHYIQYEFQQEIKIKTGESICSVLGEGKKKLNYLFEKNKKTYITCK